VYDAFYPHRDGRRGADLCGSPSGASAAPHWLPPTIIAHSTCRNSAINPPVLEQNARGDELAVWVERNCASQARVVAVSREAGHRWGQPRRLGIADPQNPQRQVAAAIDGLGGATIVWTRPRGTLFAPESELMVTTRWPHARFGAAKPLDRRGGAFALAANASGETILAWQRMGPPSSRAAEGRVVAAIRRAGASAFGHAQTLSGPLVDITNSFGGHNGVQALPSLAVAPDGTAVAAWTRTDGSASDCCTSAEAAIVPPGGRFGAPTRLQPPQRYAQNEQTAVAVSSRDDAVVAWETPAYKDPGQDGLFAARWSGHAFSDPTTLVRLADLLPGAGLFDPRAALSPDGTATIWWSGLAGNCQQEAPYRAVALPPSGPVGAVRTISPGSPGTGVADFDLRPDPQGRLVSIWFTGRTIETDRYGNCVLQIGSVEGSIDGGPTIAAPVTAGRAGPARLGRAASGPTIIWAAGRRILATTLDEGP
jgi:hypothetical protein